MGIIREIGDLITSRGIECECGFYTRTLTPLEEGNTKSTFYCPECKAKLDDIVFCRNCMRCFENLDEAGVKKDKHNGYEVECFCGQILYREIEN